MSEQEIHLTVATDEIVHLQIAERRKERPTKQDIMRVAYPVNSLWATDDIDANPSEALGFGEWEKVSPGAVTWGVLMDQTWNMQNALFGYFIWKRTV